MAAAGRTSRRLTKRKHALPNGAAPNARFKPSTPRRGAERERRGEIAGAFQGAGLPTCLHNAAAAIYERMSDLKDANAPGLTEAIERLLST